ncbi:MAG: histidine kinase [Flavobacteriales bacterium]|nr:MAG: histidine kinase [Flavobacteriales bacterium]
MEKADIAWAVVVSTLVLLAMAAFVVALLVLNSTRRMRHRAELAEAGRARQSEVAHAEREAVRHTLREVARELHDNVGQLLTVAQIGVNQALAEHPDARLTAVQDAMDRSVEELRRVAHGLDADLWARRSLTDAIVAEAERIERVSRVRAHVLRSGAPLALDADSSTILFRVFQEAVNNALKHSGADTLTITLYGDAPVTLSIADNGRGFDAAATAGNGGLQAIRRRCALIGFDAWCASTPGRGCIWTLTQTQPHGTPDRPGG